MPQLPKLSFSVQTIQLVALVLRVTLWHRRIYEDLIAFASDEWGFCERETTLKKAGYPKAKAETSTKGKSKTADAKQK
jgi:hypothetical protein